MGDIKGQLRRQDVCVFLLCLVTSYDDSDKSHKSLKPNPPKLTTVEGTVRRLASQTPKDTYGVIPTRVASRGDRNEDSGGWGLGQGVAQVGSYCLTATVSVWDDGKILERGQWS